MKRSFARVLEKSFYGLSEMALVPLPKADAVPVEYVAQEIEAVSFNGVHLGVFLDLQPVSGDIFDGRRHQIF